MTAANTVRLGDVVAVAAGQGAPKAEELGSEGSPFIRAGSLGNLLNGGSEADCEKVSETVAGKRGLRLFPKNTIVFAKSGMSATINRIYTLRQPSYVVNHLAALVPTGKYHPPFLSHWLRAHSPTRLVLDPAYPSIRLSDISELEVPALAMTEQRRIAAILDKADAIRRKHEQALEVLEHLERSAFRNLIGSPVKNERELKVESLGRHLDFVTSGSRGWATYYVERGPRFIRSYDVRMNYVDFAEPVYVNPPNNAERDRTRVQPGDVLLTITGSRIGRVSPVDETIGEAYISQHVAILRLKSSLHPKYVSMFLSDPLGGQLQIERLQYGQTKPGLNLEQVREFNILIPNHLVQQRFVRIMDRVAGMRREAKIQLQEADRLFQALSQHAFRGEL